MIDNLMLIDDNAVDQKLYTRLIRKSGLIREAHSFVMAEDALEFLADPASPRIDVILLDINMPRMNGFEFLDAATARFGDNFAKAAVIMLTTSISARDQQRAASYRVVRDYIHKPLEPAHLEKIDAMISARAA